MKAIYYKYKLGYLLIVAIIFSACTKLVEVDTPSKYTSDENAYATDATAVAVLNGIYVNMSEATLTSGLSLNTSLTYYGGVSADEFKLFRGITSVNQLAYYRNALLNTSAPNIWLNTYPFIYRTNAAIEGLTASKTLSDAVRKQLLGEAKFLRAFYFFYLVNLYGPVPLPIQSKYTVNANLPRSSVDSVYAQIIRDLTDASGLLSEFFTGKDGYSPSDERIVPTKWAAKALLARAYLYNGKYADAVTQSTDVINYTALFNLTTLDKVFLKNSSEAIWQLQPVNEGWNTEDGRTFNIPATGPTRLYPVSIDSVLLSSFEGGDQRRIEWVDTVIAASGTYFYPYKYKAGKYDQPVTEYQMVMRLAEQYLIRAEANAHLNNTGAAINDLDVIRNRAGLLGYAGGHTQAGILTAIMQERRIELFAEMGHRWLDLKRTGAVDSVMTVATARKGGTWKSYQQYYPIYTSELDSDPSLVQNEGY